MKEGALHCWNYHTEIIMQRWSCRDTCSSTEALERKFFPSPSGFRVHYIFVHSFTNHLLTQWIFNEHLLCARYWAKDNLYKDEEGSVLPLTTNVYCGISGVKKDSQLLSCNLLVSHVLTWRKLWTCIPTQYFISQFEVHKGMKDGVLEPMFPIY